MLRQNIFSMDRHVFPALQLSTIANCAKILQVLSYVLSVQRELIYQQIIGPAFIVPLTVIFVTLLDV
jgi:hypothetical protein